MIDNKILEENGYRFYEDSMKRNQGESLSSSPYKGSWQKKIKDNKGIKYFISIDLYDFKDSDLRDRVPENTNPNYSAHTQLSIMDDTNVNFEVLSVTNFTIEELESLFERQWKLNEANYYEEY